MTADQEAHTDQLPLDADQAAGMSMNGDKPDDPPGEVEHCEKCGQHRAKGAQSFDPTPYVTNLHRDREGNELEPAWPYLQVTWRVRWFRLENPQGIIRPVPIRLDDQVAIFACKVTKQDGTWAIGHGMAEKGGARAYSGRYIEKAETSATGRALALLGYGTQFTGTEFEEGDHLADAPLGADRPVQAPAKAPAKGKGKAAPAKGTKARDPTEAARAAFWAEATSVLKLKEEEVYDLFGITKDPGGFSEGWVGPAESLGLTPAQAWAIGRTCLRQIVAEVRRGTPKVEARAVVDPLGQLQRQADRSRKAKGSNG